MPTDAAFVIKISSVADADAIVETQARLDALNKITIAAGKGAKEAGVSHKELHESLALLRVGAGDALGPIGELGHFLANPYLLAVAGATLAVKELIGQHEAFQQNIQKQIELSQQFKADFHAAHVQAVNEASEASEKFEAHLKLVADGIDVVAEGLKRMGELQRQATADTLTLGDAQEKTAAAQIKLAEALGIYSGPEAAERMRVALYNAQAQKEAMEDKDKEQQASGLEGSADYAAYRSRVASGALPGLRDQREALNDAELKAQSLADRLKGQQADLDQKAAEARANYAAHPSGISGFDVYVKEEAQKAGEAAAANQDMIDNQLRVASRLKEQLADLDADIHSKEALIESQNELARANRDQAAQLRAMTQAHAHAREAADDEARHAARADAERELLVKAQKGTLSEDEKQEYAGMATRNPDAALAAVQSRFGQVKTGLKQGTEGTRDAIAEFTAMLDELAGLHLNHFAQTVDQQGAIADLRKKVAELKDAQRTLESRQNNNQFPGT